VDNTVVSVEFNRKVFYFQQFFHNGLPLHSWIKRITHAIAHKCQRH
jgi:hypothetical protein